jgi:hypothetical protein
MRLDKMGFVYSAVVRVDVEARGGVREEVRQRPRAKGQQLVSLRLWGTPYRCGLAEDDARVAGARAEGGPPEPQRGAATATDDGDDEDSPLVPMRAQATTARTEPPMQARPVDFGLQSICIVLVVWCWPCRYLWWRACCSCGPLVHTLCCSV